MIYRGKKKKYITYDLYLIFNMGAGLNLTEVNDRKHTALTVRGRVGNFGTGIHLWRTGLHSLHTVSTVRSLTDTVVTQQSLTYNKRHKAATM